MYMVELIANVNSAVNGFVWGVPMLVLLVGTGILMTILLFAFSTVLGWSHYGSKACEYLFGTKSTIVYKIAFVLMIFIGCTMNLGLAWDLSDTFNGLMAIPNLIGVIALSPVVMKITKNYVARIIKKEDVKPMLSVFPEIQEEQEKAM